MAKSPLENASGHMLSTVGRAIASVNPMGLAPMAAKSERLTARALRPNSSGLAPAKKCLPSTSMSLVMETSSSARGLIRAQSSPIPRVIAWSALVRKELAAVLKKRSIRSNSPKGLECEDMPHFMVVM